MRELVLATRSGLINNPAYLGPIAIVQIDIWR